MKCTAKYVLEHFNEMPSVGLGLTCHAMSLHLQAMPRTPRQKKYVKYNNMKTYISLQSFKCV